MYKCTKCDKSIVDFDQAVETNPNVAWLEIRPKFIHFSCITPADALANNRLYQAWTIHKLAELTS